ncbi:uncharacterized protein LOC101861683 isoform X3 [Aplysia californica]|uniref:Uncharacterized protein LOC101861683 isoform X3 n=1 Tax=Aplysia californica TaxID=6500 RepID=A0ABM1VZF0_APLCA|nr:uncharacterized protein LOC101861683 isoform X3 [Aplysia californica]
MNQLRSWLYGRDFEETTKNDQIDQGKDQLSKRSDSKSLDSKLQQAALRVIPLKTGDCLGCKLVGTSVMMASGIIVIGSAMAGKNRPAPKDKSCPKSTTMNTLEDAAEYEGQTVPKGVDPIEDNAGYLHDKIQHLQSKES